MSDALDGKYFADRAAQARNMAARAMTPAARNIHLELAADYEQKSGRGDTVLVSGDPAYRSRAFNPQAD